MSKDAGEDQHSAGGGGPEGEEAAPTKGQRRRQEILDKTREVLLETGPSGLVLRDIADQLGITHGNLQYYFPTKKDLLLATFEEEAAVYTVGLQEAAMGTSTLQGGLMAIIDSQMQELRSPETALWRMLMSMADHSSEAAEVLKKVNEDYELAVVAELERLAPQLPDQRRRHIAKIMRAIFDGLGQQFAAEKLDGSEMLGLESEVRAALLALILAEPSVESPPATAS